MSTVVLQLERILQRVPDYSKFAILIHYSDNNLVFIGFYTSLDSNSFSFKNLGALGIKCSRKQEGKVQQVSSEFKNLELKNLKFKNFEFKVVKFLLGLCTSCVQVAFTTALLTPLLAPAPPFWGFLGYF